MQLFGEYHFEYSGRKIVSACCLHSTLLLLPSYTLLKRIDYYVQKTYRYIFFYPGPQLYCTRLIAFIKILLLHDYLQQTNPTAIHLSQKARNTKVKAEKQCATTLYPTKKEFKQKHFYMRMHCTYGQ